MLPCESSKASGPVRACEHVHQSCWHYLAAVWMCRSHLDEVVMLLKVVRDLQRKEDRIGCRQQQLASLMDRVECLVLPW